MSKEIFEEKGGPHRGHAAGATDVEKQASQLASDVKYKVKQGMSKATNLSPVQVSKAYLAQLAKSPAPPAVKAMAKKKLMGEEYQVDQMAKESVISALHQVFVEGVEEKKEWIVVTDKKTGNTYRRQATRAKIAELRSNPNISRVEITSYHPDKDDDKQGQKTARVKAGKGLKNDGNLANNYPPYDKVTRGDVIAGATGKDQMGGKKKVKEDFIYTEERTEDKSRKQVTGKGVNNKKLIKVFPNEFKEQTQVVQDTQQQKPKKDVVDPVEKRQISTLQQFQRKEQQLNQQKLAAQKAGKIPVGAVQMNSYEPEGEQIDEKITAKTDMGTAIKDFYASKSPQLAGRTKEKRREAAIAAVLTARRGGKKLGEERVCEQCACEECGCEDKKESKLKKNVVGSEDSREIPTKVNLVKNKLRAMGLKMNYEPEGELVDEARAVGSARSTDTNPRGAAVRASSGRGMTMTPAGGLGASKPSGDDVARAARHKAQAKADRIAAAKDRSASGEDRLSKLIRSVQKNSFQPEGEVIGEEDYDRMKDRHLERGGMGIRASQTPAKTGPSKPVDPKKHAETSKKAMELVRQSIIAKHGKGSLM